MQEYLIKVALKHVTLFFQLCILMAVLFLASEVEKL